MSLFKKKIRTVGKGADTIVTLRKKIEELNYTPVDYKYTVQYAEFINGAEEQFRKMIDKISVDDFCESMLDAYINSNIEQMKASAAEQKTYHMHAIYQILGLVNGKNLMLEEYLKHLEQDLQDNESEIEIYKHIKKEKAIY